MQTATTSPRNAQATTQRPERPGPGYYWNGLIGEWLYNPVAAGLAKLHRHDDGRVCALSSDGITRYAVILGPNPSCTCCGWQRWGSCRHSDAAIARYGDTPIAVVIVAESSEPEPPTPAAPAICDDCGAVLDQFGGCPCDGAWNAA
jgi:hypothetical protein